MKLTPLHFSNTFTFFFLLLLRSITGDNSAVEYDDPQHAIALNCGFLHNSTAVDGRKWVGETGSDSIISFHGPESISVVPSSSDYHRSHSLDRTPYMTARASRSSFTYTFHVRSGYKFIRLHFYPPSYSAFKWSTAFFTVKSGPYTLLNNFTASLPVDSRSLQSIVKEFTLYVPDDNEPLSITFSPLRATIPSDETFAFVNGIEVVPMPPGLYYTMDGVGDGDAGAYVAGHKGRFHLGKDTAMETVYRLSVGGIKLSSVHDPSMFREWTDDSNHITESSVFPITSTNRIKYTRKTSKDSAPQRLYQSSWSMNRNSQHGEGVSFTWKLPVDLGFRYLIRLHFCELDYDMKQSGQKEFIILINNQIVEPRGDLIKWGGEIGVAIHKDYMTTLRGDRIMGKRDLVVALYPSNDVQSSEFVDSVLKGIEVFKLSDLNDNLAGGKPLLSHPHTSTQHRGNPVLSHSCDSTKPRFRMPTTSINDIIILIILLVVIIVHQLREWKEKSWSKSPSLINEDLCRRFSFAEISLATNNFDEELEIGHGGFGKVYKGITTVINSMVTMTVAIKRLDSESKQGEKEFISEIETLSKLRHKHLVSLVGYCNDYREMILVYEYMEHGTLADHLYKNKRNGNGIVTPLNWKERLGICLGAARGLEYLHNNSEQEVIHRDVKSDNILVDLNWVTKIADFGICKVGGATSHTHFTTDVKGTCGYLDPAYSSTRMLTKKSDVYAFGVVLWETLCGRPVIDERIDNEKQRSLVLWVQSLLPE
ncbi:receptor-like protein kinase FERONIA [Impatiens glandulifera]|uniref:receptor-like protein kinase FERONIA n=1 Tax=Impatiens glandulifera TaxID=253017 RepID=UPI001FB12E2C|nr:receptor-like protein kinase FERONIA [Impatiens glandulifera]